MFPSISYKQVFGFSLLLFVVYVSCKKIDRIESDGGSFPPNWEEKFFTLPDNADPVLIRAVDEMRRQNKEHGFLKRFIDDYGFINWEKADVILKKRQRNIYAMESSNGEDTVLLLPTVPWMQEIVKSIVAVKMDGSISFKTYIDKFYAQNGFDFSVDREKPNAEDVVKKIMEFENKIFQTEQYKVGDKRLFKRVMTAEASTESFTYKIVAQSVPIDDNGECITYTSWISEDGGLTWTELESWDSPSCYVNPLYGGGGGGGSTGGEWGGGTETGPGWGTGGETSDDDTTGPPVDCVPWIKLNKVNGNYNYNTPLPCINPPLADPCDSLILAMQNDTAFVNRFKYLNSYEVLNLNYEKGFTVKNRTSELYYGQSGTAGSRYIDWNVFEREEGYIHSHFRSLNSIFSGEDIVLMARVFLSGKAKDSANLFFGVTSFDGMPYLIKVGNVQQFRQFAVKIVGADGNDLVKQEKFMDEFTKVSTDNPDKNEKEFLKILKKFGNENATTLFRGNSDCNEWTRIKIDGFNDIISKQCF